MPHDHHHHDMADLDGRKLFLAVFINVGLTVVQVVAGVLSGSLALVADALHNLGDAGALVLAYVARRIARVPSSSTMTYGYRRAEIIAALINGTALLVTAIYLVYEAVTRAINPVPVNGWVVIGIAGVALVVDAGTAWLTHSGAKDSINIRAAYIHNLTDAMASFVVILSGVVILVWDWHYVDALATLGIAAYICYHSVKLIRDTILILMQAAPKGLDAVSIEHALVAVEGVTAVPHCHIWQLSDKDVFFEGQIETSADTLSDLVSIRAQARDLLKSQFGVSHATLEISPRDEQAADCVKKNSRPVTSG